MSPDFRLRHLTSLGVVAVALAFAGLAAGCGEDRAGDPPARPSGSATSSKTVSSSPPMPDGAGVIERVGRLEREHFALLREEPAPLPHSVRRILRRPTYGMNWALARRLPVSLRDSFWLVPGRHALCLVHEKGVHEVATACAPTNLALKHGVVTASLRDATPISPAQRLIVGVVPDGTSEAVVRTRGSASRVPIEDHAFVLRDSIDAPPDIVSLTPGGRPD